MIECIGYKCSRYLDYGLHAHRYRDGMNLTQALKGNMREPESGEKKKIFQVVGLHHSNEEVMETSWSKGCGSFK